MGEKIPLGLWVQDGVVFLTSHFESQFRFFSEFFSDILVRWIQILVQLPPLGVISVLTGVFFLLQRDCKKTIFAGLGLLLILNLGYWQETLETLSLVFFATSFSVILGVPLGILGAYHPRFYRGLQPILDLMQTIPTFVYLIPTLMLFGLGLVPGLVSTVIFAMPAPVRLTYLGMSRVPPALLEVGDAFGATFWQRLLTIQIPYAMPTIRAGISQSVMLSLSMVVVAALVGADGLGKAVIQALNTVNVAKGFEAGIVIVIVAIFFDRLLASPNAEEGSL